MPDVTDTQLVVLGGGPGGYAAAFLAADHGLKVTLIDASERLGGTCLNIGCIPSKALLHTAKLITDVRDAGSLGLSFGEPRIDLDKVRSHATRVVDTLTGNLGRMAKARKVNHVQGRGHFTGPDTIEVEGKGAFRFQHCIVATGSVPARPGPLGLESPRVMDSTGALKLEDVPPRLLVVGGGVLGLELGYRYAALGTQVSA